MQAPEWWFQVSATFFVFGIIFYLVLIGLLILLIKIISKLGKSIEDLNVKVHSISTRVDGLVGEIKIISGSVGNQATQIASNVNTLSRGLTGRVEMASAVFTVIGAIVSFVKARKA